MKRLTRALLIIAGTLAVTIVPSTGAAQATPVAAANAFYAAYAKQPFTGLPTGADWRRVSPRVSASLGKLVVAAQAEQARCQKKFPDEKPPWIEGDMFTSNFEGFTRFKVADSAATSAGRATVTIDFEYAPSGEKPFAWRDQVVLVQEGQRWVIDDVRYRKGEGFGNGFGEGLRKALAPGAAC